MTLLFTCVIIVEIKELVMSKVCRDCPFGKECKVKKCVAMFYEFLGKLLVASHKTLYAMMCRDMYRELKLMGVIVGREKSMVL